MRARLDRLRSRVKEWAYVGADLTYRRLALSFGAAISPQASFKEESVSPRPPRRPNRLILDDAPSPYAASLGLSLVPSEPPDRPALTPFGLELFELLDASPRQPVELIYLARNRDRDRSAVSGYGYRIPQIGHAGSGRLLENDRPWAPRPPAVVAARTPDGRVAARTRPVTANDSVLGLEFVK